MLAPELHDAWSAQSAPHARVRARRRYRASSTDSSTFFTVRRCHTFHTPARAREVLNLLESSQFELGVAGLALADP